MKRGIERRREIRAESARRSFNTLDKYLRENVPNPIEYSDLRVARSIKNNVSI